MNVSCRGLRVSFATAQGRVAVLENLSLTVAEGQFLAILGPSGCGKTTLLRTLAGILHPDHGELSCSPATLVSQERGLFPWMTALQNAAFGLRMRGVAKAQRERAVLEIFDRLGLRGSEQQFPDQLSAGMKQRVALTRAFLSDSPVLLLDEPMAALDSAMRFALQAELVQLWKGARKTVILVTHDIDEALYVSDRVVVMGGRPARVQADFAPPGDRAQRDPAALSEEGLQLRRTILAMLGSPASRRQIPPGSPKLIAIEDNA